MTIEKADATDAPAAVLVVEDELLIRMMVADTLNDAGFHVKEADSGTAALEALGADGKALRAIILDVGLPGPLRGEELIDKIRFLSPAIPILVTTGYDSNELRHRVAGDPNMRILTKPVLPEILCTVLKECGIAPGL